MIKFKVVNDPQHNKILTSGKWKDSINSNNGRIVNKEGRFVNHTHLSDPCYRLAAKERKLVCIERIGRAIGGVLLPLVSLGFCLASKKVRQLVHQLFTATKKTVQVGIRVLNPQKITLPSAQVNSPMPSTHKEERDIYVLPKPPVGIIKNGYGEYLVYRSSPDGGKIAISDVEYESIFEVIEAARLENPNDRHSHLEGKIQEKLGKDVNIAFIPRTLYEQIFLHASIQEESEKHRILNAKELMTARALLRPREEISGFKLTSEERKKIIERSMKQGFWQLCIYDDIDYEEGFKNRHEDDYRKAHLVKIASKLNVVALSKFKGNGKGFAFAELADVQREELHFFKSLKDPNSEIHAQAKKVSVMQGYTLADRFIKEDGRDLHPLGVRNARDEEILQKALQLECSAEAVNQLILYRGAEFDKDEVTRKKSSYSPDSPILANTLSYGTSLYGGALYDGGATAVRYMRDGWEDAQAMIVPLKEHLAGHTPFHAFLVHPLISLCSHGEVFHARTKLWNHAPDESVMGFRGVGETDFKEINACCKTNDSKEKIVKDFAEYKCKAYILASSGNSS